MKEASSSISYASEGERRERRAKAFVDTKYALSVAHARKTFTIFHLGARAVALSCSCSSGRRLKAETSTRKSGRETRTTPTVDGMGWVAERSRMDSKETSSYATCLSVKRFLNLNQTRFTMIKRKFLSNERHLEGVLLLFCARLCVSDSFLDVGSPICIPGGDRKQSSPIRVSKPYLRLWKIIKILIFAAIDNLCKELLT